MASAEIDAYLDGLPEPKRSTLQQLRAQILEELPDAEECISYTFPAFRWHGKVVAGFAAFTNHLSYLPHSGRVLGALAPELAGYERTTGSLHFAIDKPLPRELVAALIRTRLEDIAEQ
jgi:uncharacterized protein YdhG (YjbR/CyaY superfamily)